MMLIYIASRNIVVTKESICISKLVPRLRWGAVIEVFQIEAS
jgi:hypothetical protein